MRIDAEKVINSVNAAGLINRSLVDWRPVLARDCQVYVCGEQYIAKRFDQINYKFTEVTEAKEILIDNLYALLRYKYFTKSSDEIEKKIQDIIKSFTANLKSTLIKVSFDENTDCKHVQMLSNSQVAFRNGVFDFITNDWLFKYEVIDMPMLSNKIYTYDPSYIIQWYFNFDFEPLPININEFKLDEFIDFMKEVNRENKNFCFQLMYNIAHDVANGFDRLRFKHLCEILGYSIMQTFSQNFVLLIGAGQNGKNSLFDGCFTNRIIPKPASISLDDIETNDFITGSLENKSHNIFLETSAKTYTDSKMIKQLTGSMDQSVNKKGIQPYSSFINCKYIFAGNDQEKIKFSDTTNGFRRRINILEIFYTWDANGRYLDKGDYYNTTFSDDLHELKNDISNTIVYIYFAMYGILSATENFTRNFKFTENDWKLSYSDIDFDLKDSLEAITPEKIASFAKRHTKQYEDCRILCFDMDGVRLQESPTLKELGYYNYDQMYKLFEDPEAYMNYFAEHDIYINVRLLQNICEYSGSAISFTTSLKKLYSFTTFPFLYGNKAYLKVTFINKKLKVLA